MLTKCPLTDDTAKMMQTVAPNKSNVLSSILALETRKLNIKYEIKINWNWLSCPNLVLIKIDCVTFSYARHVHLKLLTMRNSPFIPGGSR